MYSLLKKLLFLLPAETSHALSMRALLIAHRLNITQAFYSPANLPINCMGLSFPNPVGLAAGFDKNGDYIDALAALGFGFIEIGTVTPKPQMGNPQPRLFRLAKEDAIINRMGFNNKGVEYVARRLEASQYKGILGINIGKNKETSLDNASDDYLIGFRRLAKFASYITINISSPNTPGLRALQQDNYLRALLANLKQEQASLHLKQKKYVPLVVKISPDMTDDEIIAIAKIVLEKKIDGVIATNTTIARPSKFINETGGLSGKPLCNLSTHTIKILAAKLQNQIPIIASGGIMDATSAQEKFTAGASLVQLYSGLIFSGPELIQDIVKSY